jgi:hypothetical protein
MEWNQKTIEQHIHDKIEENQTLEYKSAKSLGKGSREKNEITKDISSMANSAGGVIMYGVAEGSEKKNRHLPMRLDPVDRIEISREWLVQIVNNVRPKIDGVKVQPVPVNADGTSVIFVVTVPKSTTAHQATDYRYYRRYNVEVRSMTDDEIRDVMARSKHPRIEIEFEFLCILYSNSDAQKREPEKLQITAWNRGSVFSKYVNCFVDIPYHFVELNYAYTIWKDANNGLEYARFSFDNTVNDFIEHRNGQDIRGPSRFVPILPGLSRSWRVNLSEGFKRRAVEDHCITWEAYADNSPRVEGSISLRSIPETRVNEYLWS